MSFLAQSDVPPLAPLPPLGEYQQLIPLASLSFDGGIRPLSPLGDADDHVGSSRLGNADQTHYPIEPLQAMLDDDSSASASVSSFWDDDSPTHDSAQVWTRDHACLPRLTDHAYLDARVRQDTLSTCTSEAIQEKLYIDDPANLQGRHLAPVHATDNVLRSLLQTASAGASSHHFQWDETTASFLWARSAQHRIDIRAAARSRKLEGQAVLQPWLGTERLCGWSATSSDSVVEPFLAMAALLRRLDDRLLSIRKISNPACKETPAFAFALDTVLTWLKEELGVWSSNSSRNSILSLGRADAAILNAQAGLEAPFAVLRTLGILLSCGQPRMPPFRPLTWLNATHSCLSHLHAHLAASMASAASPLSSAVLAYLLEQTSSSWRVQVAKWIGYPGYQSDRTGELDDQILSKASSSGQGKVAVPWSGAEIDWSTDERGEEDIGYTLRPSAVPSFLTFRSARIFLEAGRALRLLTKAAPTDHPLVSLWSLDANRARGHNMPALPTWVWSPTEAETARIDEHVTDLKRSIAKWRRHRQRQQQHLKHSSSGRDSALAISPLAQHSRLPLPEPSADQLAMVDSGCPSLPPLPSLPVLPHGYTELSVEDKFARMTSMFNALPTGAADPTSSESDDAMQSPSLSDDDALLVYLAKAVSSEGQQQTASSPTSAIERCSFDHTTLQSIVAPFSSWARLINASLISVFFQDLGLGTYLETCKQFLLLGSQHFERQVTASLFDVDKRGVLVKTNENPAQQVVAMNQVLIADGVWPPNDNLLSSALNTAVIETVSGMRLAHAEKTKAYGGRGVNAAGEDAVSLAYRDLEERLSFAIIEPSSSAASTKGRSGKPTWTDPSSIDALDWLTLSFHPPPLISPLLTQLAQSRYQRLWNALLRIKRCKVAMRTAWQSTFKSPSALFTFDFALNTLMHQMRWSMGHFLDAYGSFVQEVGIEYEWRRFMERLERVKREVSDELMGGPPSRKRKTSRNEGGKVAEELDQGDMEDEEAADVDSLDEEQRQARLTSNQLELKDVFSLARYHERVLDRMLETCFLKTRQRGMAKIINSLLQCCLDFSQMCSDYHSPLTGSDASAPSYEDFRALQNHFLARMDTFVQALIIVKDRQRPHETTSEDAVRDDEAMLPKRRRDIEEERHRMMHDELEDLRKLDTDARGKGAQQSDTEASSNIEVLLVRLNAAGFYGDVDY